MFCLLTIHEPREPGPWRGAPRAAYLCPAYASHDTLECQFTNIPVGFSFHAIGTLEEMQELPAELRADESVGQRRAEGQEQLQWFNDLCLKTMSGEIAATLLEARAVMDVSDSLHNVRTPTLVLHARDDVVVSIAEGRFLAAGIPGAEFVELDSRNHIVLEHEPAWQRFCEEVLVFLQPGYTARDSVLAALSARAHGFNG